MTKKNNSTIVSLSVILLASFTPLLWFKNNLLLYTIDYNFPLKPIENLSSLLSIWDKNQAPGIQMVRGLPTIPFKLFIYMLTRVFEIQTTEKIYFVLLMLGFGLSAYFLVVTLIDGKYSWVAGLFGALAYMFNPYTLNIIWHNLYLNHIYAALPAIIALFYRIFERKGGQPLNIFLLAILSFVISASHSNPAYTAVVIIIVVAFLVFYCLTKSKDQKVLPIIKSFGITSLILFLVNLWWLLPLLLSFKTQFNEAVTALGRIYTDNYLVMLQNSKYSKFVNNFRGLGYSQFYGNQRGYPYHFYLKYYLTPFFRYITLAIPFAAITSLFFILKPRIKKYLIFFSLLLLFSLFALKGINPPFQRAFPLAVKYIPLLGMFRNFYDKLGIMFAFSYSMMVAFTAFSLISLFENKKKSIKIVSVISIGLLLIAILIPNFPFWKRNMFKSKALPSAYVKVPSYYSKAGKWFNNQKGNFYTLPIPFPKLYYAAFKWPHGYWGSYPSNWYFNKPFVSSYIGKGYEPYETTVKQLFASPTNNPKIGQALALLNVKYLIFYKDTDWGFIKGGLPWLSADSSKLERILGKQTWLQKEKQFGKLVFYKNTIYKNHFLYATTKTGSELLSSLASETKIDSEKAYISSTRRFKLGSGKPSVKILSANSSQYKVDIKNAGPSFLVFSQSFDSWWQAYDDEGNILKHVLVNGYLNGFYVRKKGNNIITINNGLQKYFIVGLVISIITIIIMIASLFNKHLYSILSFGSRNWHN